MLAYQKSGTLGTAQCPPPTQTNSSSSHQGLWEAAPLCAAPPSLPSTLEAQQTQATVNSSPEGSIFKLLILTSQLFHSIKF